MTQDCVVLTNGTHVKLILYRGHDDDELGPISQILSGMDHHCEGVGRFGLKDSWRTKLVNWAVALQRGEL